MPLSVPSPRRALKHTRTIRVEGFAREDGLWDIEAQITDIKTHDVALATDVRLAHTPIHDLWLRLTVDTRLTIVHAEAASDAVPYPGHCETIGSAYQKLVGLNLMRGFRADVRERLGGVAGCTHLTEMAQVLPTAAMQAMAGEVFGERGSPSGEAVKPLQLDRCHAALLADSTSIICPPAQLTALQQAAVSVARAQPSWDLQPYQRETAFYLAEDAHRQRAVTPSK